MKTRFLASVLLITFLFGGCANAEVLPGVYMSNDLADFPIPTSGYTVYIVGETHGNRETKLVFQAYLQSLYKKADLRDVILEEDQAYESDANAYVQGLTDTLEQGLCLRADILGQIREFNSNLPDDEKVTVHLVDIDSPLPIVYKHLTELHSKLGSAGETIQIPDLSTFETWSPKQLYDLIDELRNASANQPDILNGLDTVYWALRWYFLGNDMDAGTGFRRTFAPIREDVITKNIEYILPQLNGKPVLAFFGSAHGMKIQGYPNPPTRDFKPWAQRLVEKNISVYSTTIFGTSGNGYWRGEAFSLEGSTDELQFKDGTPLVSLFDTYPDSGIAYINLHADENAAIQLPPIDVPFGQLYDGLIIFKEFTPMENTCHQ